MLSTKNAKWLLHLLIPLFIALFSFFVCAQKVSELNFYTETIESLEQSEDTVTKLTAGALGLSVIINFLPDDYGNSLANALTNLDKYFVLLLVAIFLERLIVVEGTYIAFSYMIPIACALFALSFIFKKSAIQAFAKKIAILALAIVLVIPCGTHLSNAIGKDYLEYVNTTIEQSENYSNNTNENLTENDTSKTLIEKMAATISSAITSVKDIANNIKNIISKFMNSIAILIVTTCLMPVLMFFFFLWILQQLFSLNFIKSTSSMLPDKTHEVFREDSNKYDSEDSK